MDIVPVLDILGGQVVRGIAGRRSEYRPVVSRLTTSSEPIAVAEAFRQHFGLTTLYLADLDAITGGRPNDELYHRLQEQGFQLWIDAGIRDEVQLQPIAATGAAGIVLGLETIAGPELLRSACQSLDRQRLLFSLDLKAGECLGDLGKWPARDSWAIANHAIAQGIERLIVLDLGRVGMGEGVGTEDLCRRLRAAHPTLELIAGGGVRGPADLDRLATAGVNAALVASALHDGRLHPARTLSPMQVTVYYLAQLKQATSIPAEVLDVPPGSLLDLLHVVAARHGDTLRRLLFDATGTVQPTNLLFVNDVQTLQPAALPLKAGDVVTLLSPIAGGAG